MESIIYIGVALFGLVIGSFAGASVWRLRARQLMDEDKAGNETDKAEQKRLRPLTQSTLAKDRSRCLECHHGLAWYDLIPLGSWLSTKGRCRYCKKPIGMFEPLVELGTALTFVLFFAAWMAQHGLFGAPLELALWAVAITMLVILFAYDAKWFTLPDVITFPLIGVAVLLALLQIVGSPNVAAEIMTIAGSIAILSGLYLVLWYVSKGTWVGFGDVKLGLALGLLLGRWELAFLALFLANLIGTLIVLPGLITKKISRKQHIPFGPLLIAGFFIALLYGQNLIALYTEVMTGAVSATLML